MPQVYEYTYFSRQKTALAGDLRNNVNLCLSQMRMGRLNTPKMLKPTGERLVVSRVNMNPNVARAQNIYETRIDGHWRIFYYQQGGNYTALCIGHLDESNRLDLP